jgi:hypothetical protein
MSSHSSNLPAPAELPPGGLPSRDAAQKTDEVLLQDKAADRALPPTACANMRRGAQADLQSSAESADSCHTIAPHPARPPTPPSHTPPTVHRRSTASAPSCFSTIFPPPLKLSSNMYCPQSRSPPRPQPPPPPEIAINGQPSRRHSRRCIKLASFTENVCRVELRLCKDGLPTIHGSCVTRGSGYEIMS